MKSMRRGSTSISTFIFVAKRYTMMFPSLTEELILQTFDDDEIIDDLSDIELSDF